MNVTIPSQEGKNQPSAQKLCPRHRNKECIYLSTDPSRTDDLVFKCEFCVVEQTLQSKYLLPISQLATSDLKTVFWHWPLPDNSELLEKIRALSTREKPDAAYKQKIDSFFKEMRIEVLARIDEVQAAMNARAQTLWDFDHTILEQYSQLSAKETLKNAVLDNSEELEELSTRIRRTVTGILSDTEVATASLASSLDQLALQESAVDFTVPQRIKELVLASISSISMFLVEDMRDLQIQPAQVREMEAEVEGNLDVILRLASCRFNDLSEGFRERMSSQLQKFRKVFEKIELGDTKEEGKRVAKFDSLEEEEVKEVKAFAERLIESKKRRERGENWNKMKIEDLMRLIGNKSNYVSEEMIEKTQAMLEGVSRYVGTFEVDSIHKDGFEQEQFEGLGDSEIRIAEKAILEMKELFGEGQQEREALEEVIHVGKQIARAIAQPPQQQNARKINAEKVIELVKNETNFCREEYIHNLQAALKGVQHYLESFQLAERENEGLDREQLSSLGKLGKKIKELSVKYDESYKRRESPDEKEQPNSVVVSKLLSNKIEENVQKELDSLLCKLPIFELVLSDWKNISIQWKWMKTELSSSSTLTLQNEDNGVRILQTTRCKSQALTESNLNNNLVYSVKCTFNRPLNGARCAIVGLIPEDQIHNDYFGKNGHNSFWSDSSNGPTKIIKGQLLNSSALNTTLTTILFRFCIQTQTFLLADPMLQNITILDKDTINPNTKYRFGIQYFSVGNDISCLFSDVITSLDQASADKF